MAISRSSGVSVVRLGGRHDRPERSSRTGLDLGDDARQGGVPEGEASRHGQRSGGHCAAPVSRAAARSLPISSTASAALYRPRKSSPR